MSGSRTSAGCPGERRARRGRSTRCARARQWRSSCCAGRVARRSTRVRCCMPPRPPAFPFPAWSPRSTGVSSSSASRARPSRWRILREESLAAARTRLASQCGIVLARLHRIPTDAVPGLERPDPLPTWQAMLDGLAEPHPAFELALLWLREHQPPSSATTVVHGDFRTATSSSGPRACGPCSTGSSRISATRWRIWAGCA